MKKALDEKSKITCCAFPVLGELGRCFVFFSFPYVPQLFYPKTQAAVFLAPATTVCNEAMTMSRHSRWKTPPTTRSSVPKRWSLVNVTGMMWKRMVLKGKGKLAHHCFEGNLPAM
jgi:hypothetical protein